MELHWVDAVVRQQELNRWFPLTSPADFLYFFPYRQGVDSTKKLRIISSTAETTEERHSLRRLAQRATSSISNIWPTKFEASLTSLADHSPRPSSDEQDHRRAVPLSGGCHIIFMDPSTNLLCIGSDGPLGGPSKLARLVVLVPPDELVRQVANGDRTTPMKPPRPTAYAVAPDLSRGARVAAAYDDEVVFYSVPSDVFAHSFSLPKEKPPGADLGTSSIPVLHNSWLNEDWLDWWPGSSKVWSLPPTHDKSFPLHIQGIRVGIMEKGVSDVAVVTGQQAHGDVGASSEIVVWAFSRDGQSGIAWTLDHDCLSMSNDASAESSVVKMKVGTEGGIKTIIES